MQPNDLEKIPLSVEKLFLEMQDRVMLDVVRRIKKTGGITSTADYQIQKVLMFGNSTEYIESEIKRLLDASDATLWEIYDQVIEQDYTRYAEVYEQINRTFIPYDENETMQKWVKAIEAQTKNEFVNITQSLGFSLLYGNKRVFTPISEYYQKYLDRACLDVVTGVFDYDTVIRRVVNEMTASGIRTVSYASGYSNRVDVAARRAILTGVQQLSAKINEQVAKELGTDTFEVTAHAGARPSHQEWQGGVYTKQELESICGLGTGAGLCGWNCRHSYYAFVPGVSVRAYTDKQLEEIRKLDSEVKEWNGKEYNLYEQTQKMRQMETNMRAQREKISALKTAKADTDDITIAKAKYQSQLNEYSRFCKKMGLQEQRERIYYDGRGRLITSTRKYNDESDFGNYIKSKLKKDVYSQTELFKNTINNIKDKDVRVLLSQSLERVTFKRSDKKNYFRGKTVFLTKRADNSVIAHELFHEIDKTYQLTETGLLGKSIKLDYLRLEKLSKGCGSPIEEMLLSRYPFAFYKREDGKIVSLEAYRGISDIIHGCSNGRIDLGYGHYTPGYWEKKLALEKECFAQYGRIVYNNDETVIKLFKALFPLTETEISERLKRVIK